MRRDNNGDIFMYLLFKVFLYVCGFVGAVVYFKRLPEVSYLEYATLIAAVPAIVASFLFLKAVVCACGLVGVAVCFIRLPEGSYWEYAILLAATIALISVLLFQFNEEAPSRFDRLRYNLRKKISL